MIIRKVGKIPWRYAWAAIACFSSGAVVASTIVKPGLWELTVTTGVSEVRTDSSPSTLSVEGKAQELPAEAHRPVVAPDLTQTSHECISAKAAAQWSALTKLDRDYGLCNAKVALRTSKKYAAHLSCAAGKAEGEAEFFATATTLQGTVRIVARAPSYDRTDSRTV